MRPRDLVLCATLVVVGAWFTIVWASSPPAWVSFDIYSYYLPNMLYALQRLRAGGAGLLWNPFQDCGEPSFGISSTGPLYPFNLLFLVLPPQLALRTVIACNFAVAGIGMYWLVRELGAGRTAALCGAFAFELGTTTVDLSTWGPQMSSAYVWLPVAMLCCERLLRVPSLGNSVGLGAALGVALLPGFPQVVFFTYQLIGLRVLFEFVTGRVARPWHKLGAVAIGLALAPLLTAVHLVPGTEMAALSVRGGSLSGAELRGQAVITWAFLRLSLAQRNDLFNPVVIVPCTIAAASWLRGPTRRRAIFYTLAGALYLTLAFGSSTPLFDLYAKLPLGSLFREPARFIWMTSFCLAVLTGLGAEAIVRRPPGSAWLRRWSPAVITTTALVGFYFLSPNNLLRTEWVLGGMGIVAAVLAGVGGRWVRVAEVLVVAGPALDLLSYPSPLLPAALNAYATRPVSLRRPLRDDALLFKRAGVLEALRGEMGPQERIYIVHEHPGFALMAKSASLFQVPSVEDYEPQASRRSAAYLVMMRSGAQLTSLNQYYYPLTTQFVPWFRKRLLDVAAARYVVVDAKVDNARIVTPPLYPHSVSDDLQVVVYENQQALPRAFYVPSVEVVRDANSLLKRLADGADDLRQVALLEEPPPSGFRGTAGPLDAASADILVDEPEHVVVRVRAAMRGFLYLADQWFPGWQATVNGAPAPILRANYLFRAVEVPAGESTVEFRYRPASVLIGAALTAATVLALAVVILVRRRRGASPHAVARNRVLGSVMSLARMAGKDRLVAWTAAGALAAYSVFRYRGALLTFFFFDDFWVMHDAAQVHLNSVGDLLEFFRPGFPGFARYRPLTTVAYSYVLQTLVGYDASAQHAVQLLVFAANVVLAFAITRHLTRSVIAGTAAGLLYTVAPGQAINAYWLSAFTVTGTAFWLLVMMACWLFVTPRWRWVACALAQIAALLSCEHAVEGPALLAILAAMRREPPRRALAAIAPSAALVAAYLGAKLYYFVYLRPPIAVQTLAFYGLTPDVGIWARHLGQYLVQCFTPLALWQPSEESALLLGSALVVALPLAAWQAYRSDGAWTLVAGGMALFITSLAAVFPLRDRFGCVYICVAVLGAAWVLIGLCQLVSRHGGGWLALSLAVAMLVVDQGSDERAWREPNVFSLIVNGSLGSARWMETARRAARTSDDVLVPDDPQTAALFRMGEVQSFFPELPRHVTLYDPKQRPPQQPGQLLLAKPVPLTTPTHFPGAQPRWNWLRRLAAPRGDIVALGAQHEFPVSTARD